MMGYIKFMFSILILLGMTFYANAENNMNIESIQKKLAAAQTNISQMGLNKAKTELYDLFAKIQQFSKEDQQRFNNWLSKNYSHQIIGYFGQFYEDNQQYEFALSLTRKALFKANEILVTKDEAWQILWHWQLARILAKTSQIDEANQAYWQTIERIIPCEELRNKMFVYQVKDLPYHKVRTLFYEFIEFLFIQKLTQNQLANVITIIEKLKNFEISYYINESCVQSANNQTDLILPHTVIIYPIILDKSLHLLVKNLGPDQIQHTEVSIDSQTIHQTVQAFRDALENEEEYQPSAIKLYDWIIRPLKTILPAKTQTLLFVTEGVLLNIPMSALYDKKKEQFFIQEDYLASIIPYTDRRFLEKTEKKNDYLLLAAFTQRTEKYPELAYAQKEFEDIADIYKNATKLNNDEFTHKNFEKAFDIPPKYYDIIHLMSHAKFNSGSDSKQAPRFLLKTKDDDITYDSPLFSKKEKRLQRVKLLILSACSTAYSNDGWNALGLSGVSVKAGAESSLATLWDADDESTYYIIKYFYENYYDKEHLHKTKAQVLKEIQQKALTSRFQHPYYWAHVILNGNWQ